MSPEATLPKPQVTVEPVSPEFGNTVKMIGLAAAALGLLCFYDAAKEALSAYEFRTTIPLLGIYKAVLGIYVAARQGHQWSDPDAGEDGFGHVFVLLWLALYPFLYALELGKLTANPPIQPADLNATLTWVIGYYFVGKSFSITRKSGLRPLGFGKSLDTRLAARAALQPAQGLPQEKRKILDVLGWGCTVLGALCLLDVIREGICPPDKSFIDIHYAYRTVLAAYAGTNHWRKWTDPENESQRYGGFWVAAWIGVVLAIKYVEHISSDNFVTMPTQLSGDLIFVFSIYGLGKVSDHARQQGWRPLGLGASRPRPPIPAPPASPATQPSPLPPEAPPIEDSPSGDESPTIIRDREKLERIAAACEKAGEFSLQDIVEATSSLYRTVHHYVDVMMEMGWVERIGHGRYRWKGRGADA